MVQAAYSTDLVTLTENTTNTNMVEPTATTPESWVNLNAVTSAENDFYIQNTTCTSATIKVGVGGLLYNNGAGFTIPTDGVVLTWAYFWGPALLAATASGGIRTMIGSGTAAFYWVTHGGSDTWTYGGWLCLAMADPGAITVSTVGSPTGTRQYAGWGYNAASVPARGNPYGIDAIRYGRGTIQVVTGDATEYGRFDIIAEFNDRNATGARTGFTLLDSGYHRLGIFQYQDGAYKYQGHLLLGTAGTAVDFRDSNRSITILDTKHVTANFNLIEVRHASSRVDWTGISITKVGTVGKGRFLMTDNAVVNKISCTFTDMDTFVYQSNATITGSIYRRCGLITAGGAAFTGCTFDQPSGAVGVTAAAGANAAAISGCTFASDGTGHGLEITGTAANTTLTNNTWTGYTAASGGNEAVYVNISTGTMDLNISGGTVPSVRTAGATVNVVSSVAVTFAKMKDNSEVRVYLAGTSTVVDGIENATTGSTDNRSFTWSAAVGTSVDYVIHNFASGVPIYKSIRVNAYTVPSTATTIDIAQQLDRNAS